MYTHLGTRNTSIPDKITVALQGPNKVWEDSNVPTADDLYRTAPVAK